MKHTDITKQILALHEEKVLKQMFSEVEEELKDGVPKSLQHKIDNCMTKIRTEEIISSAENVVSFTPKNKPVFNVFAETELLAASGKSLADWFSQPMNFGGAGFTLDVRRVLGSDNEVDLYLTPNQIESAQMKKSLVAYLGKSLNIDIINNGVSLLNATLYVDESGNSAEGSGYLASTDEKNDIKGKVSISISVEDND